MLTNDSLTDYTGWGSCIIILEFADFKIRYVGPKLMILDTNIQTPGAKERIDEYYSDSGLQAKLEERHGLILGASE